MSGEKWTPEECQLVRDLYPQGVERCLLALPQRTKASVVSRARILGVATPSAPRWHSGEDEIVRQHYPNAALLMKLLPHRTRAAIKTRARDLHLQKPTLPWTGAEVKLLKQYAQTLTAAEIFRKHSHRPPQNIETFMAKHGIKGARHPPAPTGKQMLDSARRRCFNDGIRLADVGRLAGSRGVLMANKHHGASDAQSDAFGRAVELLGGDFHALWED